LDKSRLLMVGDRLDTDIAFGINGAVDTLLVTDTGQWEREKGKERGTRRHARGSRSQLAPAGEKLKESSGNRSHERDFSANGLGAIRSRLACWLSGSRVVRVSDRRLSLPSLCCCACVRVRVVSGIHNLSDARASGVMPAYSLGNVAQLLDSE